MAKPRVLEDIDTLFSRYADSNVTIYVSPTGSDLTGDGTSSKPYQTANKAASVIPKNLNGTTVSINFAAGTYTYLTLENYYNGYINITGNLNAQVTFNSITISNTFVLHTNIIINLSGTTTGVTIQKNATFISQNNLNLVTMNNQIAFFLEDNSTAIFNRPVTIVSASVAVQLNNFSNAFFFSISVSSSIIGYYVSRGSIVSHNSANMQALTNYMTVTGGRIHVGAQTDSPN